MAAHSIVGFTMGRMGCGELMCQLENIQFSCNTVFTGERVRLY